MAIKESLLTVVNSISDSDFVRAVTSAGASRKLSVSNLAKHIVENYNGSTIAGSAQSVKSALDALKSAIDSVADAIKTPATTVTNLDTATTTGLYTYGSSASGTKPISAGGILMVTAFSSAYVQQIAIPYSTIGANDIYKRVIADGTPTTWVKQPTRAEVDALSTKTSVTPTVFQSRVTEAYCYCFRVGNTVHVNIRCTANQALAGNTAYQGLPVPSQKQFLNVSKEGATAEIRNTPGDGVVLSGVSNGDTIVISGSYVI